MTMDTIGGFESAQNYLSMRTALGEDSNCLDSISVGRLDFQRLQPDDVPNPKRKGEAFLTHKMRLGIWKKHSPGDEDQTVWAYLISTWYDKLPRVGFFKTGERLQRSQVVKYSEVTKKVDMDMLASTISDKAIRFFVIVCFVMKRIPMPTGLEFPESFRREFRRSISSLRVKSMNRNGVIIDDLEAPDSASLSSHDGTPEATAISETLDFPMHDVSAGPAQRELGVRLGTFTQEDLPGPPSSPVAARDGPQGSNGGWSTSEQVQLKGLLENDRIKTMIDKRKADEEQLRKVRVHRLRDREKMDNASDEVERLSKKRKRLIQQLDRLDSKVAETRIEHNGAKAQVAMHEKALDALRHRIERSKALEKEMMGPLAWLKD